METMFKRCEVVMLSTKKTAPIERDIPNNDLDLFMGFISQTDKNTYIPHHPMAYKEFIHLYILSNDKIKDGDLVLTNNSEYRNKVWTFMKAPCPMPYWGNEQNCKKIIASTDNTLGLPTPSLAFLTKFVHEFNMANPIEEILVEYENGIEYWKDRGIIDPIIVYFKEEAQRYNCIMDYYPVKIKVDKKNQITIRRIKNSWTREELNKEATDFMARYHGVLNMGDIQTISKFISEL